MPDKKEAAGKVVPFGAKARELEQQVRELAQATENIVYGDHALERMEERGIDGFDVLRVLRTGFAQGDPERTERDEWKVKMVKQIRGRREVGVVTVICQDDQLFLKTVEWEDLK